jgi:hypothetical protein
MPVDATDKKLIKGAIWVVVILLAALFLPGYGYLAKMADEEQSRVRLRETSQDYNKYYDPMPAACFNDKADGAYAGKQGVPQEELKKGYISDNQDVDKDIAVQEERSRVNWASWIEIPSTWRDFGTYFDKMLQIIKKEVAETCREAKVGLDDPDIGFKKYSGLTSSTEVQAREYLRELFISEKIISLCVAAKKEQEKDEIMVRQVKPEAFMRIISIKPEESVAIGPSMLIPNPNYSEVALKNDPLSEKAKPFLVKQGQKFIQQYPVEIVLQCDINSFMRFLHSVRTPGQFLVIRSLEVVSPSMQDSSYDKSEFDKFLTNSAGTDKVEANKDERVFIRMSAEGMDFFDSEKFPDGLHPRGDAPSRRARETLRDAVRIKQ